MQAFDKSDGPERLIEDFRSPVMVTLDAELRRVLRDHVNFGLATTTMGFSVEIVRSALQAITTGTPGAAVALALPRGVALNVARLLITAQTLGPNERDPLHTMWSKADLRAMARLGGVLEDAARQPPAR